jgi:tRNA(fMet)-specific endonuclease VapC
MIKYLLDTNICVFHLRGKLNLNQVLTDGWHRHCCISDITVLELYYGAESSNNPKKHREAVALFLEGLTVLPVSRCVPVYAKNKAHFRKIGKPLHDEFDLIIGSTAAACRMTLVTDNVKHFSEFPALKIENWLKQPPLS